MAKRQIAVMDIGSSKIRILICKIMHKRKYDIIAYEETDYSGFNGGNFVDYENLKNEILNVITKIQTKSKFLIKELYVGLLADFLLVKTKQISTSFLIKRKIKKQDIYEMIDKGNDLKFSKDYSLITCSPISYTVNTSQNISNPIKVKAQNLSANFSYIYADSNCVRQLNSIFEKIGLLSVDYVASPLAEFLYLLEEHVRNQMAIIVDCGYKTTHVLTGRNKGLLSLSSFSVGGIHITNDLSQIIKIDSKQAENLKRKAVISLSNDVLGGYDIVINDADFEAPAKIVSDIIKSRIDMIASGIKKAVEVSNVNYPNYMPIFLTGGGLSLVKGAKEYLSKVLNYPVEILSSKVFQLAKPQQASLSSIIDVAVEKECSSGQSFLAKLIQK